MFRVNVTAVVVLSVLIMNFLNKIFIKGVQIYLYFQYFFFITFCIELFPFDYNPSGLAAPGLQYPAGIHCYYITCTFVKSKSLLIQWLEVRRILGHLWLNYCQQQWYILIIGINMIMLNIFYVCLLVIAILILKHWILFFFYPSKLGIIYWTNP